jgi:hypothetical protein
MHFCAWSAHSAERAGRSANAANAAKRPVSCRIPHGIIDRSNALAITLDKPPLHAQSPPSKNRQHHRIARDPDDHACADGLAGACRKHPLPDDAERVLLSIRRAANTSRRTHGLASTRVRSLGDMRVLQPDGTRPGLAAAARREAAAARTAITDSCSACKTLRTLRACLRGTAACAARLRLILSHSPYSRPHRRPDSLVQ